MNRELPLKVYEQFSAYLDGQLAPAEKARLEQQLKANPDWRLALEELGETRTLLRRAPHYRAPRNFTLSPEQARQLARKPLIPPLFSFRFSAAMAVLALIAIVALQLLPGTAPATQVAFKNAAPLNDTSQPSAAQAMPAPTEAPAALAAPLAAPTQTASVPQAQELNPPVQATAEPGQAAEPTMIIQWNSPYGLGGGGGGPEGANGLATGKGGGPGGAYQGNGIVTYGGVAPESPPITDQGGGPINIPLDAAAGLPTPTPPAEATPAAQAENPAATELPGGGPILGIPDKSQSGKVLAQSEEQPQLIPTELPHTDQGERAPAPTPQSRELAPSQPAQSTAAESPAQVTQPPAQAPQPGLPFTRILQGALLVLAVLAAVAAFILRRRA
jgi:hypothetical protein